MAVTAAYSVRLDLDIHNVEALLAVSRMHTEGFL